MLKRLLMMNFNVKTLTEVLEKVAQDGALSELNFAVEKFAQENFSYEVWTRKLNEYLTNLLTKEDSVS